MCACILYSLNNDFPKKRAKNNRNFIKKKRKCMGKNI